MLNYVRENFLTLFLMSGKKIFNIFGKIKQWPEIKICCRASSVLAGKFWQTPPELRSQFRPWSKVHGSLLGKPLGNCFIKLITTVKQ
jgi:hypothetical protein